MRFWKLAILLCLVAAQVPTFAQRVISPGRADTLRIMQYNLLRFPGTTGATRMPLLKRIINYSKPHLITINEMSVAAGADQILNGALNVDGETRWRRARFIGGPDPYNMLYYRADLFGLHSQDSILTAPRWTTGARLFRTDTGLATGRVDTTWFTVYQMHLLASQGTSNEVGRNTQCQALVARLNQVVRDSNVLVTGDFNLYRSTEAAYQTLLAPGPFQFVDPINRPGSWNNNAAFADIHTQSPRTTSFGGGANGGMDDRFDFILTSNAMQRGTHYMRNLPNTYKALGNDGQHFNGALTTLPNGVVPDSIALALHDMSDHLPVLMDVVFTQKIVTRLQHRQGSIPVQIHSPNPTYFTLGKASTGGQWQLLNQLGQVVASGQLKLGEETQPLNTAQPLPSGIYTLSITGSSVVYQPQQVLFWP